MGERSAVSLVASENWASENWASEDWGSGGCTCTSEDCTSERCPGEPADPSPEDRARLSHGHVLVALGRQSLPHVLEATLVPAIISYVLLLTVSPGAAMIAVLVWTYFAVGRRLVRGREIPAILLLATVGLTVRTIIGVASGSTFAYFVQPVATTVVLAALFAGSVVIGRPVIGGSRRTSASSHPRSRAGRASCGCSKG